MSACDDLNLQINKTLKTLDEIEKREAEIYDDMANASLELQAHIKAMCAS